MIFWSNPQAWPSNIGGYLFLAAAVHEVGELRFPGVWTGREMRTPYWHQYPLSLPSPIPEDVADDVVAALRFKRGPTADVPPAKEIAPEDYAEFLSYEPEIRAMIQQNLDRWTDAVSDLSKGLMSGDVVSALRRVEGGGYTVQPKEAWFTEQDALHARFAMCLLDPGDLFSRQHWSPQHQLIYVSRDSLDGFKIKLRARYQLQAPGADVPKKPAATLENVQSWFRDAIVKPWRKNPSNENRVTNDELHALAGMRFTGASTYITREAFKEMKPDEWGPGKFPRTRSIEQFAADLGLSAD